MGDRGNIVIQGFGGETDRIYLYTHWEGSEIEDAARKALASPAGQGRLNDPPYLARIVFDVLTEDAHNKETGFGIATSPPDNEHPVLVIDCAAGTVAFEPERGEGERAPVPISEFIAG